MRHVIGPSWSCVECLTDKDIPEDDPNTAILTVWGGYMLCLYHLPTAAKKLEEAKNPKKSRPVGDIIDGQCTERKYGVNGVRRCQFAAHHSDPHSWGDWE